MRGDGRIFQRTGSPFWWCAYYLRGKQFRESTGETDEKKALKFLQGKLKEVHADQIGAKTFVGPQQQRVTVDDLLNSLESDYTLRGKWNTKVNSSVKPLREHFGHWRAVDITSDAVSDYIKGLQDEGYADATCNRHTQLLGQAFKLAVKTKKLSAMPFIPHLSEVGNERQGFFEAQHLDAVLQNLPEYLRDFARCGFLIGWRKGALQSLRWSDVTEDVIYLQAKHSKNRKPESVPLEGELGELIGRRRAEAVWQDGDQAHFSEFVFHREGKPIGDFRKAWKTACRTAGVPGALFHDFRRTAARNLVRAGVPVPVAMKITGHRTDSMFRRYAIVDEEQKREALAKAQAYLANNKERKVIAIRGR